MKSALQQLWRTGVPALSAVLVLMALAVTIGWVGFLASDDSLYYFGAEHWLRDPPFAGDNHWTTRFPLLWSFAAMLALCGRGFAAFAATALLWYAALIALVGLFAWRAGGARVGWIAAMIASTLPVIVANGTTVGVDLLETGLLLGGAWLLGEADRGRHGLASGLLAGVCFGSAIICRETSLLALSAAVPLFLVGRPVPRQVLIAAGLGIAVLLGGEALFQWALTGEPLRRYAIAFNHDSHIDRAANHEGNFLVHPVIDPVLVLLINDDFGLLFWVAGWAALSMWWRGAAIANTGPLLVLAAMALADFVLVSALTGKLVLNPRYFMLPAIWAIVAAAQWLDALVSWRRWPLLLAMIGLNLLMLSVGNAHPRWEMEVLIEASRLHPGEVVSGDPVMVRRARLPMRFADRSNIRYAPARSSGLVVAPLSRAPVGKVLGRFPSPPTVLGRALLALGVQGLVPRAFQRRMFSPNETMVLVRTPPQAGVLVSTRPPS